jgi:hypothetical protein
MRSDRETFEEFKELLPHRQVTDLVAALSNGEHDLLQAKMIGETGISTVYHTNA